MRNGEEILLVALSFAICVVAVLQFVMYGQLRKLIRENERRIIDNAHRLGSIEGGRRHAAVLD